ncbi:hypothetical protein ACVWYU_001712 [Pseudomonas sp. TE12234]
MVSDFECSDQIGLMQFEASKVLDHFILGASLAICTFLTQTNLYQSSII